MPSDLVSRLPKYAIFAVVGLGLAGAVAGRVVGISPAQETGSVIASRDLRFADRSDGAVVVTDAGSGQQVDVLTGEQGFIRATLRGLARTRRMNGVGAEPPFRLSAWSDGHLTLDDTSNGRRLELLAYGVTNATAFGRLLGPVRQAVASGGPL